ncbi:hypothetical protein WMF18_05100 [Sorangium sp. So ce315]|uniref:hypothetical protein n=1 Tax=Sorangium sp. So ce315 TaxID=3133299 RepID=UPI003F63D0FE
MALNRASVQRSKSLEEFYGELKFSTDSISASTGGGMLDLLPLLKDIFSDRDAWALTSLMRLWLLAADDPSAPWLVSVAAMPGIGFQVTYRMSAAEAPWPDAFVQGTAVDEADACRMVRIAVERCRGWTSL